MNRIESINEVVDSDKGLERIVDSQEFETRQYEVVAPRQPAPVDIRDVHDLESDK
jgi:hypothetical protein